jgi:tetrahydromethanopterin S-methyltransferase subunit B
MADYGMADFVSNFWHWFVLGITVVSILALFPLVKKNQERRREARPRSWDMSGTGT